MKRNPKISAAVAAILSAPASAIVFAAPADTATATSSDQLMEVVVTAQRRTENLQDVPITIQAFSGDQLQQLNVVNFTDLLKYTPNVTYSGNGPGTGNIFMRGLGSVGSGNQSLSTTAAFPNVALYLDDQSMQFPGRNNDVYLVDMERVEVLEGPQGTLFGGGAQAGAIRYITNKPKLNATSGDVNAGYGITAGGDPNTNLNAVLNLPLIDNVLAVRGVVFNEVRGGYIDNVPGTIGWNPVATPAPYSAGNPTANNGPLQGNNLNKVTNNGARLTALWQINDNWDALLQQNYQNMEADGYFYDYPQAPDGQYLARYQITAFAPAYTKDNYESTAWTLNGKIPDLLSMVYTGSYLVRHIDGQQDYSNYMRSVVGSYYACIGTGAAYFNPKHFPAQLTGTPLQCSTPVGNWRDQVRNTHQSHELRFATTQDWRVRGLAGFYWEKFVIDDNMNFNYLGIPQCDAANLNAALNGGADCLSAVGPVPGAYATDPSLRTNANTAFGEDAQRGYKQKAFFTSIDVDVIPKVLVATGGIRFYHYDEFEEGSEYYSETTSGVKTGHGVVDTLNGVCTNNGGCGFPMVLSKSESGHRWRGNLTWHVTDDVMSYYTYSEGFRPGGFNRTATSMTGDQIFLSAEAPYYKDGTAKQFYKPAGFGSDQLINQEVGIKSEWLEHRLLFNVSGYVMHWSNVQLQLFDPVHLGNTTFNVNGPEYKIKGFEVQFVARLMEGLTWEGSSSVNSSEQVNGPCLPSNVPKSVSGNPTPLGQCVTQVNGAPYTNPYGVNGTRPPFSPPWMFNTRFRYEWVSGVYKPWAWIGASHMGPMSNEPASFPDGTAYNTTTNPPTTTLLRYQIPSYTLYDAGIGVGKDNWTAEIQGSNITNAYGPTNVSSGQYIQAQIPLRPRVITFQFGFKF